MAVIVLHVATQYWEAVPVTGAVWGILHFYDSLVRWAVPVFIMVSGAMFIKRDISLPKLFGKYILRLVLTFFFWGLLYQIITGGGISFYGIFYGYYHLWFLPMLIGLYICQPVFRTIAQKEETLRYTICIILIFGFAIPWGIRVWTDFGAASKQEWLNGIQYFFGCMALGTVRFAGYFLLGYYLRDHLCSLRWKRIFGIGGIIGFAMTFWLTKIVSEKLGIPMDCYYDYCSVNVFLMAVAVFVLGKDWFQKSNNKNNIAIQMARVSFGVYLVHPLFIYFFQKNIGLAGVRLPVLISVPLVSFLIFCMSGIASAMMKSIPGINNYLI